MPRYQSGLLTIRAWTEPGSVRPLRVHIQSTTDVSAGFQEALNLTSAEEVGRAVRRWLDDIEREAA
jgi:hypothetical protein